MTFRPAVRRVILLLLVLAFALAGCGGEAEPPPSVPTAAPEVVDSQDAADEPANDEQAGADDQHAVVLDPLHGQINSTSTW